MTLQERIVRGVRELPTLPTVYAALSDAMARPGSTAKDIADIVSSDQASLFRVLRVVNSAFYGFPGRIDTISRAIVILGFDEIRNLILATSVMNLFKRQATTLAFRPGDFWAHSLGVGLVARQIGQAVGLVAQENLFVAGVIHDIGKLVLFEFAEDDYSRAINYAAEHNCSILDAESETLALNHPDAGNLLGERWNLPESLRHTIRHHHEGSRMGKPDSLVATIHLADMLARAFEMGFPGDNLVPAVQPVVWDTLRVREGQIAEMYPTLMSHYVETRRLLLRM